MAATLFAAAEFFFQAKIF